MVRRKPATGQARSGGPRILFLVAAIVTTAILLWTHQLRHNGGMHGLSAIFFVLFADNDSPGTVCALLILVGAFFGSRYLSWRGGSSNGPVITPGHRGRHRIAARDRHAGHLPQSSALHG